MKQAALRLHDFSENMLRFKLATRIAETLYKDINVVAVGLCGSVVRGESTQGSDLDLIVVVRKAAQPKRIVTSSKKGAKTQVSFLTVGFLTSFVSKRRATDWFDYRLITRLRETAFLFSKEPEWTIRLIQEVAMIRPTRSFLETLRRRAFEYLSSGRRYLKERNNEMATLAFRGCLECIRRLAFASTLKEFGGHKWGLVRLKMLDNSLYRDYVATFARTKQDPRENVHYLGTIIATLKRRRPRFKNLADRDIDILTDILQDTRDMIALGRITEAKVILAQTSLVMYLPSFSLPISPRKHPGLAQLILRASMLNDLETMEVVRIFNAAEQSYKFALSNRQPG